MDALHKFALLSAAAAMMVSCSDTPESSRQPVSDITRILQSPESSQYKLLEQFDVASSNGTITIMGDPDRVKPIAACFIASDLFDNVDGREEADYLPDFAGEVIAEFADSAAFPYYPYFAASQTHLLQQQTVNCFLEAMGSSINAKIVVLADPYLSSFGHFDIDTLLNATSCAIPFLSAQFAAIEWMEEKKITNAVILTDSTDVELPIYDALMNEYHYRHDETPITLTPVFSDDRSIIRDLVLQYVASGRRNPVEVILVDGAGYDTENLRTELKSLLNSKRSNDQKYLSFIAENCEIMSTGELAARKVYLIMRERNIFTHNVSFPTSLKFTTN